MTSPNREFLLGKEVTEGNLKEIIEGIQKVIEYDNEQSKIKIKHKRNPIKLTIDSFGGDCWTGMALVNLIDSSKTPIYTYCYGKAMSMALTIYAVGHKRFAHKKATFMQHQFSGQVYGKHMDIVEGAKAGKKLQKLLDGVLLDNSNIDKEILKDYRKKKKDWFFDGEEAFELGLVDKLLDSNIKRKING